MKKENNLRKVVLCGGGTGGHIFPSIAVAEKLKKEGCDLYYIGVSGKPEEKIAEENGIDFYDYSFSGFPRKLSKELFVWPFNLLRAVSKAKLYLKHFKPDIVFGTGGYSAAPVFIAAKRLKIPYIVHNLDVRLGLANKFCANGASLLTLGFDSDFNNELKADSVVTGNPIRNTFLESKDLDKQKIYEKFGFSPDKKTIFVIGGSQGANAVNEVILDILKDLVLKNDIQVIHQTGEAKFEVHSKRIPAKVIDTNNYVAKAFFHSVEKCYRIADLVISRAGAMTTTEITCLGKPAIFIPYPFAGNHQEANVTKLVNSGGGILMRQNELRSTALLNTILALITDDKKLASMSNIAKSFGNPDATDKLVEIILSQISDKKRVLDEKEFLTSVV